MDNYFIKTIELYFGSKDVQIDESTAEVLHEFVNNPNVMLLQGYLEGHTLRCSTKIRTDKLESIIFYKTSLKTLSEHDIAQGVSIITLSCSPAESLYQILKQIYGPLLMEGTDLIDNKLQQNLSELESNLRIITHGKTDSGNFQVILSIEDEIEYWNSVSQNKKTSKKDIEAAKEFSELFAEILEEMRILQTGSLLEIKEVSENICGLLDDVWRHNSSSYGQDRMKHAFDIIGHTINTQVQNVLNNTDIWILYDDSRDNEIASSLSDSLKCMQTWTSGCQSLTDTYWPNHALHPWEGKSYVPSFCLLFLTRIKEVYDMKCTYLQLNKLLTPAERTELNTDKLFDSFQGINVWSNVSKSWQNAVAKFTISLRPIESKIAEKLKPRLHNSSIKQTLYEFMRYKILIQRPHVKDYLKNDLELFLSSLAGLLKDIQRQIDQDGSNMEMYTPPEMSPIVHQVQWAKQTESKVKDIKDSAENYLKEFERSAEISTLSTKVLKDLKNMYTQLHEEWSRDLQAQVKDGTLRLSVDKPVVQFSSANNLMVVQFNPRLVALEGEARGMAALGLPAPAIVKESLDSVAKVLHYARALQQVASFHNTLGERMILSTRPLMLEAALNLSSLVQEQKAVYWDNIEQVAHYTNMLKEAVLKLETQNTYLTNQHISLRGVVESLLDTDLLLKQSEWKKKINQMRDIIEKVESNGYKNTELWRSHWDWQLYKVLECQYIKTLLSLHKHFPHVRVDLVLRGHEVRSQPPLEELRAQHYQQLRRLVSLPAHFVGLQYDISNDSNIFCSIVDKHSWLGNKCVSVIEAALSGVQRACTTWARRAAVSCTRDLQQLCRDQLSRPEHWEHNFRACKAYGQAVAKMTFEDEKVEWISIGTESLRREFETQVRNLWGCLISSLQENCRTDAGVLDAFIASANLALDNKSVPKNAKELGEISAKHRVLQEKMPEMEKTVEELKKKCHMLHTWGGDASVEGTVQEWLKIREVVLSQQQMFQHQAEIVKTSLTGDWDNLTTSLESWSSRWIQNRSCYDDVTNDVSYTDMTDRCLRVYEALAQWEQFVVDRDELLAECSKFGLNVEQSDTWKHTEKMISDDIQLWAVFKEYDQDFQSLGQQEWIVFHKKLYLIDEFVSKWRDRLEPYTAVTLFLQQELDKYTDLTPILKYVRGNDFTERHWREVYGLLGMEYRALDVLQVTHILAAAVDIKKHVKDLLKIATSATSEAAVRGALTDLELWFAGARLSLITHRDKSGRDTSIVGDLKDITSKVEEQQWVVSGLREDAGSAWDGRLSRARTLLRDLHHAQRRWLYMEPILHNDDGELGARFRKVDNGFRQVSKILEADPRLATLLQSTRIQPMLDSISDQLSACQTALNDYIDEKRKIFPRFYFLSDDDLLELLGQARSGAEGRVLVLQNHLKKLFPGITGVKLGPESMSITALCSDHAEVFTLEHPVDIDNAVEVWLKNLEDEMRSSLKNVALNCITTNSKQNQDIFSLPTQIICLAQNIRFTDQTEKAIVSKQLQKLKANIEAENKYYAEVQLEEESENLKRQALILQCVYYVYIIQQLIDNNITTTNEWLWHRQLRFYITNTNEIVAKMGIAELSYSYEYLGTNTGQFVRTELADECFLILTQAFELGLVGNPFGPAGTGKTESVKALGALVGRLVLVFNCDEAMDQQCMCRLLSGVARCGAWGCFDEFNRLSANTLATIADPLVELLAATRANNDASTVVLNGKQVQVNPWCAVAATMNPVGRGYGGRRSLPAVLSRALRPAAMPRPRPLRLAQLTITARTHCAEADRLADDLCYVYRTASELLSDQRHYDWGLRALKSTIGSLVSALTMPACIQPPRSVLRHVLRRNNLPKLTQYDAHLFEEILSVVFNDVPEDVPVIHPLTTSLENSFQHLNLIPNESQVQKCIELHEQLQQRMGVVIVGDPGSGKTTTRQLLKAALTQQGRTIVEYVINPKALSREGLLGHIDVDTRQWTDGVISTAALEISTQPDDIWSWVVCDGDIDPEWVEALNSVLDDNRLLSLPSGWRVYFRQNVNFLFETDSLEHASPATVSRLGVILLGEQNSCAEDVLSLWIENNKNSENDLLNSALPLLQKVVRMCLQWRAKHASDFVAKVYDVSLVKQILAQMEYMMKNVVTNITPEEMVGAALCRTVFSSLKENAVEKFESQFSELVSMTSLHTLPMDASEWRTDSLYMSSRLLRSEAAVRAATHLLLSGPSASAKFTLAEYILKDTENAVIININCTPNLQPSDIIAELKRHVVARTSGSTGPTRRESRAAPHVVLLVRSLQRAHSDAWGCSAVQQLLWQLIDRGGFWEPCAAGDGSGAVWCAASVRVVATCADRSGLCARFAARLANVTLTEPDDDELQEIVTHYLKHNSEYKKITDKEFSGVASSMLAVYKQVVETFTSQKHYEWNASDLKKWCDNMIWYKPRSLDELIPAVTNEASYIFRDRLLTDDEITLFDSFIRNHFKLPSSENTYYATKLRGSGVYMEAVVYKDWLQNTQKVINQCLAEHDSNVFGDSGAEVCAELSSLCAAIGRTLNGGVAVCVGAEGTGRRAASYVVSTALSAALFVVNTNNEFQSQFKNATSVANDDNSRALLVLCPGAATSATLATIETTIAADRNHRNDNSNTKTNLGIIICLDKDQEDLPELFAKFPFLYKDSHVVWQEGWCQETLRQMPQLVIQRLIKEDIAEGSREEHNSIPVEHMVHIYDSLPQQWMRAPCRYISFLKTYYYILRKKKSTLLKRQKMLSAGVSALEAARETVSNLSSAAEQQSVALQQSLDAADRALSQLTAAATAADSDTRRLTELRDTVRQEELALQKQKAEIDSELATVEPVITAARAAVGEIKTEALSEVRSLRAPPDVVRDILEGVLRLMGIADTSWHSMKTFLAKRGVKEEIKCLDASQISPEAVRSVEQLLRTRGESFSEKAARRASAACAPLAAWVTANLAYAGAAHRVQPLQRERRRLQANLKEAEDKLVSLTGGVSGSEARVKQLSEQLAEHSRTAAGLELAAERAAADLQAGNKLLEALGGESGAWEADLEVISKEINSVGTRSLLAAAYVVYLTELTEPEAREFLTKWSELLRFEDCEFSVINYLASTEKQLKWDADGLPQDTSALKNAVIIDQALETDKCGMSPYIVDPDGAAFCWLQSALRDTPADYVHQHSEHLSAVLLNAARLNRTVVVTSAQVPTMPALGARVVLYVRDIDTSSRQCYPRLATVQFAATSDGLTDQLVQATLQHKDPEAHDKVNELKLKVATLQRGQYQLQERLLEALLGGGDIMKETALVEELRSGRLAVDATRAEAAAVDASARAVGARWTGAARAAARLGLAARAAGCKLGASELKDVFVRTCLQSENLDNEDIIKNFTRKIIDRILLSIPRDDKYVVVLYLLKHVYSDVMTEQLWKIFIESDDVMAAVEAEEINYIQSKYKWLPDNCAKKLAVLQRMCPELSGKLNLDNSELWTRVQDAQDSAAVERLHLSSFETVVVVAALCPALLYRTIVTFVDRILGSGVMTAGGIVERAARHAGGRAVMLRGPHGGDLLRAARPRTRQVSAPEARAVLREPSAAGGGGWLLLSARDPDVPALVADLTAMKLESECMVWVAAEDVDVPSSVAAACLDVLVEPPQGIRSNVLNTLSVWESRRCSVDSARALADLAMLHAVLQERRHYIPGGWSQWYDFSWGDVSAVAAAVERCGCAGGAGGLATALYGGRLLTAADERALKDLVRRPPPPRANTIQEYIQIFSELPSMDTPEMLCLPANCRRAWETTATRHIICRLKELNTQANLSNNKVDAALTLRALMALWKRLVAGNPLLKGDLPHENSGSGWWWCVVLGEARAAAAAARSLTAALAAARRGHLAVHEIPERCSMWWAGPASAAGYVRELAARVSAAARTLHAYRPGDTFPPECDVRLLLRPERLLSALCTASTSNTDNTARPELVWVPDSEETGAGPGTVLTGLSLLGARWHAALLPLRAADPAARPTRVRLAPRPPRMPRRELRLPLCGPAGALAELSAARARGEPPYSHGAALVVD